MDTVQEPITPSHLMTGRQVMSLSDGPYNNKFSEDVNTDTSDITKRIIHLNKVLEYFWRRWKIGYLLELREAHHHSKHPPRESNCGKINIGDVVLVQEESQSTPRRRFAWKIGNDIHTVVLWLRYET